ncbi:MAG: AMP-binding protein [Mojavia pulchra JT2-VF2]|jgi:acyl-CoA synthetase (AMP-forming)/AMP-acid ligase II/thioesterase domain-containing protein|uniref:AMP-binding protein n=1 Tax=Mojavia pulchra JT2-VF2 TaxID=287848 RepID=A0A951Q1L3_9NOST|nr:AMP-binding protein [Mojavia pulchra JT2-VF2]
MAKQELQKRATSIFGTSINLTIEQLVRDSVKQNPQATAIAAPGRSSLSYMRLYEHMQDVNTTLNALGLGLGDRIAIVLPNGPEMAVAFLAVTACATSAPLNPAYSAAEFDFYFGDLNAKALIVQAGIDSPARKVAMARNIPIIELVPQLEAEAGIFRLVGETHLPPVQRTSSRSEDTALVLHTSGTTARPKIVPLTQANLYISAQNIKNALELGPSDRCLNVMPLFHVQGLITAILSSVAAAASVACTPGFDNAQFFAWLQAMQATWYTAVPTIHQAVLNAAADINKSLNEFPRLRFIRSGGAALPRPIMTALEELFQAPVLEGYGMTETGSISSLNPLPPRQRKPGSVGIAAGLEIGIMDETGHLLKPNQIGEIVVQGGNVMLAYENNSLANQSTFTNGWFRTGDQGYLDHEGYLFITGRLKEQINRGGEKISPREIDEVLLDHPAVAQAVAFAVPHPTLGEDLAAAIVLRQNASVTAKEIREFAATKLADFKVPTQVVFVKEIPKGSTGKLQRIGLADKLTDQLKATFVAPRTDIEKLLATIWVEVLGIEQVGIYDNFFALGGDSLVALRLFTAIEKSLGQNLPISTLLQAPTVEQLATKILQLESSQSWSSLVTLQPFGSKPPLFCIHGLGGEVLCFRELAMHLGTDQPLYGLQPQGLDGKQAPFTRLEDMAAHYVEEIQTIQSKGPYFLGGYSFGGNVAFEMAQQLRQQGEEVALLVMFDSCRPGYDVRLPFVKRLGEHLNNLLQLGPDYLWQRTEVWRQWIPNLLNSGLYRFKQKYKHYFNVQSDQFLDTDRHLEISEANKQALSNYEFQVYPGRVVLFRTDDQARVSAVGIQYDPQFGWGDVVTGGLDIYCIPGSHFSLLNEPYVKVVAEKLHTCLDQAQVDVLRRSSEADHSLTIMS